MTCYTERKLSALLKLDHPTVSSFCDVLRVCFLRVSHSCVSILSLSIDLLHEPPSMISDLADHGHFHLVCPSICSFSFFKVALPLCRCDSRRPGGLPSAAETTQTIPDHPIKSSMLLLTRTATFHSSTTHVLHMHLQHPMFPCLRLFRFFVSVPSLPVSRLLLPHDGLRGRWLSSHARRGESPMWDDVRMTGPRHSGQSALRHEVVGHSAHVLG